jgi:hypothetical protein
MSLYETLEELLDAEFSDEELSKIELTQLKENGMLNLKEEDMECDTTEEEEGVDGPETPPQLLTPNKKV